MSRHRILGLLALLLACPLSGSTRVLLPVVIEEPISTGYPAIWQTQITVHNDTDGSALLEPYSCSFECPELFELPPHITTINPPFWSPGVANLNRVGQVVRVWQTAPGQVSLAVQLTDRSNAAPFKGVSVPIVPESEFRTGRTTLLPVSTDSRVRQTLRIYDLDERQTEFHVRVFRLAPADTGDFQEDELIAVVTVKATAAVPASALDEFPAMAIIDRLVDALNITRDAGDLRITIEPVEATHYWAFVSVTDNETSHIKLIVPSDVP